MQTFIMFGKYSDDSLLEMSKDRTDRVEKIIRKYKGDVQSMYALLGQNDLVFIVDFPSTHQAMKASIEINKLTKISITTSPAVSIEEFDRLMHD